MTEKELYKGIIVSHTHWDREWYLSFQEFRKRLVSLIDDLLDNLPKQPAFKSFMLDGQTVLLEDYLEIRPERADELRVLIQQKRLFVGPFYVLADEFLESGEGIIRNLLLGHKISEKLGTQPLQVGYVPDTFGHIWQLPQILAGFNIKFLYYFRGYPPLFGNWEEYEGNNDNTPLEHFFESPDGTKSLALHHILGYSNGAALCFSPKKEKAFPFQNAIYKIKNTLKRESTRIKSNIILFMNGDDHATAEWDIPILTKKWNNDFNLREKYALELEHGTLEQFFNELDQQVAEGLQLPILTGELRGSAYTQVTPGCISTRMNLKLLNWRCSLELEKYAEPLSAMNSILGASDQKSFIEIAWKWLIQNHPHDSICGCSLDRVHEDMITRFRWSLDISSDVVNQACSTIIANTDRDKIREQFTNKFRGKGNDVDVQILGLFNPHPFNGPFLVEGFVRVKKGRSYKLFDYNGVELADFNFEYIPDYRNSESISQELYKSFKENWFIGKISALVNDAPPCGYRLYVLASVGDSIKAKEVEKWTPQPLKTDHFIVKFNINGSIRVKDLLNHYEYHNLNLFEDFADDGDEYDYGPLKGDNALYTNEIEAQFTLISDNKLFTEVRAKIDFSVPYELIGEVYSVRNRSDITVTLQIVTEYRVYKHIPRIDIKTKVRNEAKGHRLRTIFPSDIIATHSYADDHFMVIKRTVKPPKDDGWFQDAQNTYHNDAFVDLTDGTRGLAVFNRGLGEFEIIETPVPFDQSGHAIALTLYRSVGWLSQHGHLGRKSGLNGPNIQTPGAQMLGHSFEFEYSLYPHEGNWEKGNLYRTAYAYIAPPLWFGERMEIPFQKIERTLPLESSFLTINNPLIVFSTFKVSDRIMGAKDGIILRMFNPTDKEQYTELSFETAPKNIFISNLLEQDVTQIPVENKKVVELTILPFKIVSLRINF